MLKKTLLNIYFWPIFTILTLTAFAVSPFILLGNLLITRLPTGRLIRRGISIYGWLLVRVVPFMAPVRVEDRTGGIERSVIFVPNHCSSVDPYLFGMLPFENAFVTSWPFKIPLYNFFMHLAGYINSNQGWEHVLEKGSELLADGCSLIIWPEGHRSRDGNLRRFMNGAFQLSLSTGRPIVPVCVIGSRRMLPPGNRLLTPSRIRLILLPPVFPSGNSDNVEDIKNMKDTVRNMIAEELDAQCATNSRCVKNSVTSFAGNNTKASLEEAAL